MKAKISLFILAVPALLALCGSASSDVPTQGLISYWTFDEGSGVIAYDSAGSNHGTIHGATWTTGQINGALSFDGVDDYVALPDNEPVWLPQYNFTLSAWVYFERDPGLQDFILDLNYAWSSDPSYRLGYSVVRRMDTGVLTFAMITTNGSPEALLTDDVLAKDSWYHVVAIRNGTTQAIYIDGQLNVSRTCSHDPIDFVGGYDDNRVNIGRYTTNAVVDYHLNGSIDDVRIYERALSPEEIQELYAPYFPGENLVVNGGFETTEVTSGGWPSTYGDWSGDHSYIFARYGDVWPFQGSQMLQFVGSSHYGAGGSEESCQVYQIIDVSQYADIIAAGQGIVWASAYFNRAEGDAQTDTEFVLTVHAHEGDPCSFTPWELVLDWVETSVYTDSNPATWEQGKTQLVLPTNTDYVVIGINAMENIYNDSSWPEFDGHFADAVSLRIMVEPKVPERVYYVDGINGDDNNDGLSPETAFATIQKGIDTATDGNTVIVYPAVYTEPIDFSSKAITLQGVPSPAGTPILEAPGGFAVSFSYGEEPNSVLKNFVIRNSNIGVFIADASPTISNVTIVDNVKGVAAYGYCDPDISNSIFWNNSVDLYQCEARYTFTQDVNEPNRPLEGLISHWRFDEGGGNIAYDWFGNNHGTVYGATWTTGQINSALSFDGVDDYVEVPDDDSLNPSNQITISFWIYNRGGKQAGIYKYAGCPGEPHSPRNSRAYFMCVRDDSGKAQLRIHSSTLIYDNILSSNAAPLNEWHYIAGTFNQGNAAVYIDGQLDNSDIMSVSSIMNDVQPLMIGGFWYYCGTDTFRSTNGIIDDVRIYDRALSAEEILQVYQNGVLAGPLFADPYNGDYHLLSERGRYWPQHDVWVLDEVSSPCLDGGDPMVGPSNEPMPNGGRINQGAYGGTAYASMSEWPIKGDINRNGRVDFHDVALLCNDWLSKLPWVE